MRVARDFFVDARRYRVPVTQGVAFGITQAFYERRLDLSARTGVPGQGWSAMPEVAAVDRLVKAGARPEAVRLFLTFVAALDRARDADRLWRCAADLFIDRPWLFAPDTVLKRRADVPLELSGAHVSQRHRQDADCWIRIAQSLQDNAGHPVTLAIYEGRGSATQLLKAVQERGRDGRTLFPFLQGPKVRVMWVRLLAYPGMAAIEGLEQLAVAVDVQVLRVSRMLLGTAGARAALTSELRQRTQQAWAADIATGGCVGPAQLGATGAAADPAIWFFGKWGCSFCEHEGRKAPVAPICARCLFGASTPP